MKVWEKLLNKSREKKNTINVRNSTRWSIHIIKHIIRHGPIYKFGEVFKKKELFKLKA